jgi:hypothetical protein
VALEKVPEWLRARRGFSLWLLFDFLKPFSTQPFDEIAKVHFWFVIQERPPDFAIGTFPHIG